jgi:hypothetical protein
MMEVVSKMEKVCDKSANSESICGRNILLSSEALLPMQLMEYIVPNA